VGERLFTVRQRQQVVHHVPADAAPAQVVGDPCRLDAFGERAQAREIVAVEWVDRADRQRHAVQHDRVVGAHARQDIERSPASDEKVLRNDLEPIDGRARFEHVAVVRRPQADAIPELREFAARETSHAGG
jgi:hypothetical protein